MKGLEQFEIDISSLKNKEYQFQISGESGFFTHFQESLLEKGSFEVHLILNKSETLIHLDFYIKGILELVCDRSLETFEYPFETKARQILQFGSSSMEILEDDEIELINRNIHAINVAPYVYEIVTLAVPMKKLHPRFLKDDLATEDSNLTLVYSSSADQPVNEQEKEPEIDPRWEALKNLKK